MVNAKIDDNRKPTLIVVNTTDGETPMLVEGDPATGELLVKSSSSTDGTQLTQIVDAGGENVTVTGNKLDVNVNFPSEYPLPASQVTTLTPPAAITGFATSANQTNASQKSQIVDGSGNVIGATSNALDVNIKSGGAGDGAILDGVDSGIKATVKDLTNSNPVATAIVDANGDQITSFGGGVQYTEGDTDSSMTGTVAMVEGAADTVVTLKQPTTPTDTQPISAASLPLPTGAATAAKQLADNHQVTVSNIASTPLGLTDDELRATAVPVSVATIPSHNVTNAGTFAVQSTNQANSGVDIGDVTINNSTGVAAVNIQDGGNSITVDGAVTVTNSTATNLKAEVVGTGTFAVQASQATASNLNMTEASAAAIKTAVEALDNAVDGNYLNVNLNLAGTDCPSGNGTAATSQRVTIASDSTGQIKLAAGTAEIGKLAAGTAEIGNVKNSGTFAVQNDNVKINGVTLLAGNGATGTGSQRVTIASDNTAFNVLTTSAISGIGHGVKTVTTAGTDVALAASTACKRVTIQAQTDNTSIIAVGGSGVDATIATGTGVILYPGDVFELDIDNLADIYIDSLVNGEGVRYCYFT
jgi:hypothetical protein